MITYSIKYLESISGIKAHTIRIWEKRYHLLTPKRTSTNIRYYDNDDLRKILNIITLLAEGYKISAIAKLNDSGLNAEVKKVLDLPEQANRRYDGYTNDLIVASFHFDKASFDKTFNTCVLRFGFIETMEQVLYPALKRTGIFWQSEEINAAHEHFLSNLVKQKLFSAIDGIAEPAPASVRCVLFLPDNEEHEIGLLYSYYQLLKAGIPAIYLGQRTPLENVQTAQAATQATHLLLFVVTYLPHAHTNRYLKEMNKLFPQQIVLVCGRADYLRKLKLPPNFHALDNPGDMRTFFKFQ